MTDEIGKSLGLDPLPKPSTEVDLVKSEPREIEKSDSVYDDDYEYARTNFYNVIEKGTDALEEMLHLAKSSEHPRAFEVVSTLMKTLVDANKDLVKMNEDRKKSQPASEEHKKVTNNNLFVGSTAQLQKMLNGEYDE